MENRKDTIAVHIMPDIQEQYEREKEWILRRLRENREKYEEDIATYTQGIDVSEVETFDASLPSDKEEDSKPIEE